VTDVENKLSALEIAQAIALSVKTKHVPDVFAEDAVYVTPFAIPGTPERVEGREAIMAMFAKASNSPLDVHTIMPTFYQGADPNIVTMVFVVTGQSKATGKPFNFTSSIGVLTVIDGKIQEWRDFPNLIAGSAASGTIPQLVAALEKLA
jgi:ketosteroid isomerase-like protein